MYGIIYKATNLINGKLYIGQTNRKLETRMKRHLYDAKIYNKTYFHRAINKYGEENFKWEVIDVALDQDELDSKEKYWIKKLKTYYLLDNSNGYNMTDGGYGASGEHHPSFNKEVKVSTRKKISSTLSGKYMGSNNVNSKPVIQIGLNGEFVKEFDSMSSAKRETGILHISDACRKMNKKSNRLISKCCKSGGNIAYGYKWMFMEDYIK